jgi:hypothetical protein
LKIKQIYFILGLSLIFSCKNGSITTPFDEGEIVASIGNKNLYSTDIQGIGLNAGGIDDSLQVVQAFIENWVRNNALLLEAEDNYTDNATLDKLVKDYRNSLLLYEYESRIVAESLDTVVTKDQIREHYNKYNDQYLLSNKIFKYWLAIVPAKASRLEKFYNDWRKGNEGEIRKYCKEKSELCQFSDHKWNTESELHSFIPEGIFKSSQYKKNAVLLKNHKGKEYFVKIFDVVGEGSVPPIEYIDSKIEKVILNNRKQEILNKVKDQLYKKQLNANNVKLYIEN